MAPNNTSPDGIPRLVVGCIAANVLAALTFLIDGKMTYVGGISGGIGIATSLTGTAVAAWFSVRARDRKLFFAALLSVPLLAFWCWVIYGIING